MQSLPYVDIGVIYPLYFALGWPYRRPVRLTSSYRSPSGVVTVANLGRVPCGIDREILLALFRQPLPRVTIDLRELSTWLGAKNRRPRDTRPHLERVMTCSVYWPGDGPSQYIEHRFGSLRWLDRVRAEVALSDWFLDQTRTGGTRYSLEHAARLRAHPARLDLYLCLRHQAELLAEFREHTHEIDPAAVFPSANRGAKARQSWIERLSAVQDMIAAHLCPAELGTGILLDLETPRRVVYQGGSRVEWSVRAEHARAHRQKPPEQRAQLDQLGDIIDELNARLDNPPVWESMRDAVAEAQQATATVLARVENLYKDS
jgi:hypothetical protein